MIQVKNISVPLFQFEKFKSLGHDLIHFVSTRNHDFLPSASNCFTIGLNGDIDNQQVLINRKRIAEELNFLPDSFVFASQVHGNRVAIIDDKDRGRGAFARSDYIDNVDALVTNKKGICLVAQAADCVSLLFYDPHNRVIAAAHAGWKGTVLKIGKQVVDTMKTSFLSNPKDIVVGIGPSAGPCCYEVGSDVIDEVKVAFGEQSLNLLKSNSKPSKAIFNLWEANRLTLLESGINIDNIEIAQQCTICDNHIFFSARKGDEGRFGAGIMLA